MSGQETTNRSVGRRNAISLGCSVSRMMTRNNQESLNDHQNPFLMRQWGLSMRRILVDLSLVPTPAPSGEKRSGDRSEISSAYLVEDQQNCEIVNYYVVFHKNI